MTRAPRRAVIDASVAVKIFVPEALSPQAQAVFFTLSPPEEAELIVPDFFFICLTHDFLVGIVRLCHNAA